MKHRLFEPGHLVALKGIEELKGIREEDGWLRIGAAETLDVRGGGPDGAAAAFPRWPTPRATWPGPSSATWARWAATSAWTPAAPTTTRRRSGGGALGYCLKKDGDVCHVTRVGKKCVAAHSADTPPVLMVLDAVAVLGGPGRASGDAGARLLRGRRDRATPRREPGEIVTEVRIPLDLGRAPGRATPSCGSARRSTSRC